MDFIDFSDVKTIPGIMGLLFSVCFTWKAIHEEFGEKQREWVVLALVGGAIAAWGNLLDFALASVSMAISIGIYLKQDKQTQEQHNQTEDFRKFEKDALENLRRGSQDAFDVLVAMRNDDLRRLSQDSKRASHFTNLESEQRELEKRRANYWTYKWIFETHEHATLIVKDSHEHLYRITIKILKTTKNFRSEKLIKTEEYFDSFYYLCQVDDNHDTLEDVKKCFSKQDINFYWDTRDPYFWKGRQIACTFSNDKVLVYSSQNEGKISLKGPCSADCKETQDVIAGKSIVQNVDFIPIHSEDPNYVNRIADHQISKTQEKPE